ncbi:hypothetical protein [Brevundimonas sp. DC300-4]|uniref:hypothetical protein n=1 Tax=Brevundimonas sp. DC300-4 TaxID=2804594 RepID=UPI003CEBBC37
MTDTNSLSLSTTGDLVVAIRNSEPLGVDVVADLLRAMGDDYRMSSGGRTLAVREMRAGSLLIHLWDAAQFAFDSAATIVTLVEFTKLIRGAIEATKKGRSVDSKGRGMKTVRALIKASRESHAEIEIDYEGPNERIQVRLSRLDAEQITLREVDKPVLKRLPSITGLSAPQSRIDQEIEAFARTAARDDRFVDPPQGDGLLSIIGTLVHALLELPGGRDRLQEITRRLRSSGDETAAVFLEGFMGKPLDRG